eukprot:COSAG06_NODE_12940_length_1310_cov_1.341866_2_plen_77_part_00
MLSFPVCLLLSLTMTSRLLRSVVAAIWTQTTDVEEEINGLLSYDREQKLNLELAAAANRALVATAASIQMPETAKM